MRRTALKYISPRTNGLKLVKNEDYFWKTERKGNVFFKTKPVRKTFASKWISKPLL